MNTNTIQRNISIFFLVILVILSITTAFVAYNQTSNEMPHVNPNESVVGGNYCYMVLRNDGVWVYANVYELQRKENTDLVWLFEDSYGRFHYLRMEDFETMVKRVK